MQHADVDLRLNDKVVSRCCVDTAFILEVLEGTTGTVIRIGGRMNLEYAAIKLELSGEKPEEAGRACILIGKTIKHAVARFDGSLEVVFADGYRLDVPADGHYEAWEASADDGFMVVSRPGGGLSVWNGHEGERKARKE